MERISWNDGWKFAKEFAEGMEAEGFAEDGMEPVRLPHANVELPLHYFDEGQYQTVSGYRRHFRAEEAWRGKRLIVTFEGVAHRAEVFVNGQRAAEHNCGYTAFSVDITPYVKWGEDNVVAVRADSRESLNVPPFGKVIDYMTFGGMYREAWLAVKSPVHIGDVFVRTPEVLRKKKTMECDVTLAGEGLERFLAENEVVAELTLYEKDREKGLRKVGDLGRRPIGNARTTAGFLIIGARNWDLDSPSLYALRIALYANGELLDEEETTFGFRQCEFRKDGFYLNGKKVKIRGLNRHQSYPYVGYAMPKRQQERDAEILKWELGVNAVRTSHYPQSRHFLNRCDELGLLVFTEIPGWQHIGDAEWKEQAILNTREMVTQYRNHPSIVLWGVRVNESQDDDELYRRTNHAAHELDPTRQTGGVRYIQKSSLLEDVYTYNDFSHDGKTKGVLKKRSVTPDMEKGYLISEYNGHMFPTKSFDCEEHRLEHALRHCRVMDGYYGEDDIAGGFGWCMFDYNTHKDFGSGDRVCYHGVMDMFRNPKLAAAVYESQSDDHPVCVVSSSMDIGEHPRGCIGDIYAFTNADSIRLYKNGEFVKEFSRGKSSPLGEEAPLGKVPSPGEEAFRGKGLARGKEAARREAFPHMPHPPIVIDDLVGELLERHEGYDHRTSEDVKEVLNGIARHGSQLPPHILAKAARLMAAQGFTLEKGTELYNKYVGNWGEGSIEYTIEAVKDGKVFQTIRKAPPRTVALQAIADTAELAEGETYDVAAVRIRAVDENGNLLPYFQEPVELSAEGAVSLIGPGLISLEGGMAGAYVRTVGKSGRGALRIRSAQAGEQVVEFEVR